MRNEISVYSSWSRSCVRVNRYTERLSSRPYSLSTRRTFNRRRVVVIQRCVIAVLIHRLSSTGLSCRTFSLTFVRIVIYALADTVARPRPLLMRAQPNVTPVTTSLRRRAVFVSLPSNRRIHYCAFTGHLLKLRSRCLERSWPANWLSCDHVSRDFVIRTSSRDSVHGVVLIAAEFVRHRLRYLLNCERRRIARANVVSNANYL